MPGHGGRHGESERTDLSECAMRYALLSDVHANLPALDAVLADIAGRGDVDGTFPPWRPGGLRAMA